MDERTATAATGDGTSESTHTGHLASAHPAATWHRCPADPAVGRRRLQWLGRRLCAASTSALRPSTTILESVAAAATSTARHLIFRILIGSIVTPLRCSDDSA